MRPYLEAAPSPPEQINTSMWWLCRGRRKGVFHISMYETWTMLLFLTMTRSRAEMSTVEFLIKGFGNGEGEGNARENKKKFKEINCYGSKSLIF